ncbi:PREDICTED: uncharacterized protein LOC109584053 [Amphimedon queenslandica]|uniref:Uncharacterized protein n=1 Tax=Amphimedon queenslandica TaxID=400682 RepID=A0A1X7UC56_AMPQE|nr:PREDICTED: uncharacterized protein LOC109584053 [Amphimedon queenslandica]|eukprot:XP_019855171.1 PREDICTED: uncharacterized protein LOC109584053 [Amphimedon queenslandica]
MPRSVLVSYSPISHVERNKVITIPDTHDEDTDLMFLKRECLKSFNFGSNVSLSVVFQKYDVDWDSFVDLDDDCYLEHKDKLRFIVTPQLHDSSVPSETNGPSFQDSDVKDMFCSIEEMVDDEAPSQKKFKSDDDIDDPVLPVLSPAVIEVHEEEKQEGPLPDPFPFPKNFSSEVELALSSQKMTKETTSAFLSQIASAMFFYKRKPTKEEYTRVAKDILLKYPFMKPSSGSTTGGIIQALIDRFKQFRRIKKPQRVLQVQVLLVQHPLLFQSVYQLLKLLFLLQEKTVHHLSLITS